MQKLRVILLIVLISIIGCEKEVKPENPIVKIQELTEVKTQIFDLDTISSKVIVGEKGTKIYYNRNDLIISNDVKATLVLKELYTFNELFLNNINTITNNNELLESSGVLYIEFNQSGKEIKLKDSTYLKIEVPDNRLTDNLLFQAKLDSLEQFEWVELEKSEPITSEVTLKRMQRGIISELVTLDTIAYSLGDYKRLNGLSNYIWLKELNWINIDRFIENINKKSFRIDLKKSDIKLLNTYLIYENYNSFVSFLRTDKELNFKNIPIIKDSTILVAVGLKDDILYADKKRVDQREVYNLDLKEINKTELLNLIK